MKMWHFPKSISKSLYYTYKSTKPFKRSIKVIFKHNISGISRPSPSLEPINNGGNFQSFELGTKPTPNRPGYIYLEKANYFLKNNV